MTEKTQRRLAAIVSADVVGYSRLVGIDETGTISAFRNHRDELIDAKVAEHGGRIVKTMGDGLLLEFPSVVDATQCAIDVQHGMAERNEGVDQDKQITLRIGVNLGDIVIDGEDILGDGVNIAARLQEIAEPGGVTISRRVHEDVQDRLTAAFDDTGEQSLKNIARPVHVWRWSPGGAVEVAAVASAGDIPLALPDKPSIAVLPFNNMSGDQEQEYFADGMTEDIITDVSKVSGLFVIARNSSFAYKGKSPDIRQVSRELGVAYVLEGSVRRAGNRVRINAQLIKGSDGSHIWADRYDRDLEDIFSVQDEVTREIVDALKIKLTASEEGRREHLNKVDPEAYDYYFRGRNCMLQITEDSMAEGRRMMEKAIEIDPDMSLAFPFLALIHNANYLNRWNDWHEGSLAEAMGYAEKATELDSNNPEAFAALAHCQMWHRDLDEAEINAKRCVEIDPNSARGWSSLGQILDFRGDHDSAVDRFQIAYRHDPHFDMALSLLGRAQFALGRDAEAEENLRRRLIRNPRSDTSRAYLAALYGATGRVDEAKQTWQDMLDINPDFDPQLLRATLPYTVPTWFDRFFGGLENAGLID